MNGKATIIAQFLLLAMLLSAGAQPMTIAGKVVTISDGETQWKANKL